MIIPNDISIEAQAFYQNPMDSLPMIDFSSPCEVQALRDQVTPLFQSLDAQIPFDYTMQALELGGIECYQFAPNELRHTDKVILYLHGGGLIFSHPTLCQHIPASVSRASGIKVISIAYPLAPEHSYSEMVGTVLKVINSLDTHYAMLTHSAGGSLALSAVALAKQDQMKLPAALAMLSPMVDHTYSGDSMHTLEQFDAGVTTPDWLKASASAYLGNLSSTDKTLSPLHNDLTGLPPTYIQQAGRDILMSNAVRLNRKLLAEGVNTTLDIWDGMWHGFNLFPLLPEAEAANSFAANFLEKQLTG